MPLSILSHNELHCLYDKIFDPFCDMDTDFDSHVHHKFESLRTECKYYTITTTGTSPYKPDTGKLFILHLNVRSILNNDKFEAVITFLHLSGIQWDIVCISETWLTNDVEQFRNMDGYTAFFENRIERTGGGVAVYIRNDCVISCTRLPLNSPVGTESLFIQCNLPCSKVIIGQVYRPPNTCPNLFTEQMSLILDMVTESSTSVIIAGDFNFDLFNIDSDANVDAFFNMFSSYGFLPSIPLTTRQSDSRLSLLDNIYCNNITNVDSSGIIYDDLADHFPVYLSFNAKKHKVLEHEVKVTSFNYKKVDDLQLHLQAELHDLYDVTDPNAACERINLAYSSGINRYSFTYEPSRKNTPIKPWITPAILASINRKNELFILKSKCATCVNILNYRRYRNVLIRVIRESKRLYIYNELKNANPKNTWKILNELKGSSRSEKMPDAFKTSDGLVQGAEEIADNFNAFFTNIGKELKNRIDHTNINPMDYITNFVGNPLHTFTDTNEEEVKKLVNDMRIVGGGHDKINTRIFKATFMAILSEIVHFMNLCLQHNIFPNLLKKAVVKPIFKAGDKQQFNNYRPISLLPVISKLLEKLIYIRLVDHLDINHILNENQFGFRKGMSTYMPILLLQEKITNAFEANHIMCGLYLDLRKAFDTVSIDILLNKIQRYGITNNAYNMIKSYLTDRTQCVQINEYMSNFLPNEIGVPQGSILGPLLFILYINDFPNICDQMTSYLYADDTAIFVEGRNEHELQNTLDILMPKIAEWFLANQLTLNTGKTYYQIYTQKKMQVAVTLQLAGADIIRVKTVKYLGVFIDDDLKWNTHIAKLYTVLCRNTGIISRVKYFLHSKHLLLLYNSLFLSYVNYCCFLYSNTYSIHINKIEKLQKRVIRIVDGQTRFAHSTPIFKKLKLLRVKDIGNQQMLLLMHRKLKTDLPRSIDQIFAVAQPSRISRNIHHFEEIFTYKVYKTHTISWAGPRLWNQVIGPMFPSLQMVPMSKSTIKRISKNYFLNQY